MGSQPAPGVVRTGLIKPCLRPATAGSPLRDPELMCHAHAKGARVVLKGKVQLQPDVSTQLVSLVASSAISISKNVHV